MAASREGHSNIVKKLLDLGANPNLQNHAGSTALSLAVGKEKYESAMILVEYGANIDLQNEYGATALMLACNRNQENLVQAMLEHGADISITNNKGETALQQAQDRGYTSIVDVLQQQNKEQQNASNTSEENTLGISCNQVLKGIESQLTDLVRDTMIGSGLPILHASTPDQFVSIELDGNPDDLLYINISLILSPLSDKNEHIQYSNITYQALQNIFTNSPEILQWYNKNLKIGLKQQEEFKQTIVTSDTKLYVQLSIAKINGSLVVIEIMPN